MPYLLIFWIAIWKWFSSFAMWSSNSSISLAEIGCNIGPTQTNFCCLPPSKEGLQPKEHLKQDELHSKWPSNMTQHLSTAIIPNHPPQFLVAKLHDPQPFAALKLRLRYHYATCHMTSAWGYFTQLAQVNMSILDMTDGWSNKSLSENHS